MTGTAQHVNHLGASMAVALPAALWLATRPRDSWPKQMLGWLGASAVAAGLLLSGSLGAIAAAVVGLVAYLVITGRIRLTVRVTVIAILAFCVVTRWQVQHHAQTPLQRFAIVQAPNGSVADRRTAPRGRSRY